MISSWGVGLLFSRLPYLRGFLCFVLKVKLPTKEILNSYHKAVDNGAVARTIVSKVSTKCLHFPFGIQRRFTLRARGESSALVVTNCQVEEITHWFHYNICKQYVKIILRLILRLLWQLFFSTFTFYVFYVSYNSEWIFTFSFMLTYITFLKFVYFASSNWKKVKRNFLIFIWCKLFYIVIFFSIS